MLFFTLTRNGGGVDVTATFMMPIQSLEEWGCISKSVDDLCTVLTLISGNRVTWVSARAVDSLGYPLLETWRDSVTNSFTTHDILNTLANDKVVHHVLTTSYVPLIETMVSQFSGAQEKWNIRAAINTWHETVISDHFMEQRGLLICACMEMLRTRYLVHGGRATVVNGDIFRKKKNELARSIKKSVKACFPAPEALSDSELRVYNTDLSLMYRHVANLNYFPFGKSLQQMASELDMRAFASGGQAESIELRWSRRPSELLLLDQDKIDSSITCFVRIRDHLTHQGQFISLKKGGAGARSQLSAEERSRQLAFLQRFVAAFLCSTLGWIQPLPGALNLMDEMHEPETAEVRGG